MAEDDERFLDSESEEDEENSAEEAPEQKQAKALVEEALSSNIAESATKDVQPANKPQKDVKSVKDVSKDTNIVEEKEEVTEEGFLNEDESVEEFMEDDEADEVASNEQKPEQETSKEELKDVKSAVAAEEEEKPQPEQPKPSTEAKTEVDEVLKDEKPAAAEVVEKKPEGDQSKPSAKDFTAESSSWDEDEEEEQQEEEEEQSSDAAESKPHLQKAYEGKQAHAETVTEIYVGNLAWKCEKKDLRIFFQPYGDIQEITLPKMRRRRDDEWHWVPEGWAFIRFATHEQAVKALKGRGGVILNRKIKINLRNPSRLKERPPDVRTIYVSNLNYDATEKDLLDHFGKIGKITDIRLQKTKKSRKNNVGYGHIDFADPKSVDKAIKELNGKPMLERSVRIDWAAGGAAEKESAKVPSNCKTIRITNVPKKCGRQAVLRLVSSKVGACFVRFMKKGFNRGCFVDFKTNQQVKAALNAKMTMAGVKLRVCWAPEQESYWVNPKYASADRIVFVMPVNLAAKEADVSKAMSKYGKVKHIVIEPHSKAAHCYIIYKEAAAAKAALKAEKVMILEGDRMSHIKEYSKTDGKHLKRAQGPLAKNYSCAISNIPFHLPKKAFVNLCDKLIEKEEESESDFFLIWKMKKEKFSGIAELIFEKRSDAKKASKKFKEHKICGRDLVSVVVKKNGDLWKRSVEDLEAIRNEPNPKSKRKKKKKSSPSEEEKSAKKRKTENDTSTASEEKKRKRGVGKSEGEEEKPSKRRKWL